MYPSSEHQPPSYNQQPPPVSPPAPSYGQPLQIPPPAEYATDVQTPPMIVANQWSTGLCDCGSDIPNCCLTFWCPCIPFGQIAEIADLGTTSCGVHGTLYTILLLLTGCQWIYSCMYRSKLRQQFMLPEEPCNDCLVHFCCEPCAMCQEYRELRNRGFDMSAGWHGNMGRHNIHGVMVPPSAQPEMKR